MNWRQITKIRKKLWPPAYKVISVTNATYRDKHGRFHQSISEKLKSAKLPQRTFVNILSLATSESTIFLSRYPLCSLSGVI